jgi:hypothetical protein
MKSEAMARCGGCPHGDQRAKRERRAWFDAGLFFCNQSYG